MRDRSAADGQRWSGLRLSVFRNPDGSMSASLIHRQVNGRRVFDTRLDAVTLRCEPGDPASTEALEALRLVVEALAAGRGLGPHRLVAPRPPTSPAR